MDRDILSNKDWCLHKKYLQEIHRGNFYDSNICFHCSFYINNNTFNSNCTNKYDIQL